MKIEYDKEVDALYIRIQEKMVAHTKEIEEGINLDLDADGRVIGIEIIGVHACLAKNSIFLAKTCWENHLC